MAKVADRRGAAPKDLYFRYQALTHQNRRVKGTLHASSESAAYSALAGRGYTSVAVRPAVSPFSLEGAIPSLYKVKPTEVSAFSRQFATLLDAGISLLPALQLMTQQRTQSAPFRRILGQIASTLSTGTSFSSALAQHDVVFDEVYRRSIEVGEKTGQLQVVLKDQANHIERQIAFKKSVSGALTYPMIVSVAGLGVVMLLITFVMPKMSGLFASFGAALPLPTRVLLALSVFVLAYKVHILVVAVVVVVPLVVFLRQPEGRRFKERVMINMPVLGPPAHMSELARITRTMSMMLRAGLPLQEAMDVLPRTCTNSLFREALERVRLGLLLGQGLSYPMAAQAVFLPLLIQMIRIGEDSNNLDSNLSVVADFYEATAQERVHAMVALITPLSTIVLAALVGFVALAVIMPMYSIAGTMA
ncbi:MAG: type II secretion system F family protein [Chloroflexota bacterium]